MKNEHQLPSSFRDPSGFLFSREGILFRQINQDYADHFDHFESSGLAQSLIDQKLLLPYQVVEADPFDPHLAYKVIRPEIINFISYPYEWSFSQLKDAAHATLKIQRLAFDKGMVLKDASAFNIQFRQGKPLLIDTLSFEIYRQGDPWIAYRQFCQHFLAPLAVMAYRDICLGQLSRVFMDGMPVDLASRLLPTRTWLNFQILTHIHLHAISQRQFANRELDTTRRVNRNAFLGILDSLQRAIDRLDWNPKGTDWAGYYEELSNYSDQAFAHKEELVGSFLQQVQPSSVWDLGANIGTFSRLSSNLEIPTVAFDLDFGAVEANYLQTKELGERFLLPLVIDLTNPSGAIGWDLEERKSLLERGPVDMVLALALVHHLAITNNVPLSRLARFLQKLSRWLVIEFVPKQDEQVERLLLSREDIFETYDLEHFEEAFLRYYRIRQKERINQSTRTIYLMEATQ